MKRSQYSMEFLIFFAILTVIFFVWLVIYSDLGEQTFAAREKAAIEDLGKSIQAKIFAVSNSHSGFFTKDLIIPPRTGPHETKLIFQDPDNGSYVFYFPTEEHDYIFHIPFTLGNLSIGENTLWNICGVVAIGDFPPLSDSNCNVKYAKCYNRKDDDGDNLIDYEDGGCYRNYILPSYNQGIDDETTDPPVADVYNYYVLCRNAAAALLCNEIDTYILPFTKQNCCDYTEEDYCC